MAWLCVDQDGTEYIHSVEPYRDKVVWAIPMWKEEWAQVIELPAGSIEKLIGRPLTWSDEPVELTDKPKQSDCRWDIGGICMKRTMSIMGVYDCPDFELKKE